MASRSVTFSTGLGLAFGSVPWNTSPARRNKVDWLPSAQVKFLNADGTVSRVWYAFLKELSENRLGGIHGITIPQVATTVTQTQAQVVTATAYTDLAVQYARGVAATAEATAEVAQNNGLAGADSIPPSPEPPAKPTAGSQAV